VKKNKQESKVDFGSYSDLFMVLAFVFLLLYVLSSLNNGIALIQEKHRSQQARQELEAKVARYEQKVDEALTETQRREYQELRDGLEKMREDARLARLEQEKLARLAEEKEQALAKYQDSVKTMAVIQARANEELKLKAQKIAEATQEVKEQNRTIASLQTVVESKEQALSQLSEEVSQREAEIAQIQERVKELSSQETLAAQQAQELKRLQSDLSKKESQLKDAKSTQESLAQEKAALAAAKDQEISDLQEKFRKATAGLRREIAASLASRLKQKGIIADVDKGTGDVTVRFTNAYFDYNSSNLKDEMKRELETFIPIYAKSLFGNKRHAASIASIEIVGSASPSFKGQYINPRSIASVQDKAALNYNLDLSYRRAKKIFEHTFFTEAFKFDHKEEMMPMVKVTGTGYLQALEELKELPTPQQDKAKGFCGVYDCQAYQKVTLKFNLKEKAPTL
jgi:myosin heavy subunit